MRIIDCRSVLCSSYLVTLTSNITQFAVNIIQGGMARGQKFLWNIFGWDVLTSNRLPVNTYNDGTTTGANYVGNIFMCVLDDQTKPVLGAWRRMPKRSEEHTSELQSLMRISYAVFCFKKKKTN